MTPRVRYTFTRSFPTTGQAQLWVWIESSASADGIQQTTQIWDYTTLAWTNLDGRVIATSDKTAYLKAPAPFQRFVDPGAGLVRVRVMYGPTVAGLGTSWQARIDKMSLGNVPAFSIP